jgi:Flp pilus assembly protein TadD
MLCTRRNLVLLCLVVLFVAPLAIRAQQGSGVGSIVGELHLSRGDFPGRVFVELQLRGAAVSSIYSDDQGRFGFYGIGNNPYHVVIRDERFNAVDQLVVVDTSISAVSIVQINLSEREPVKTEPLAGREQGSNPHLIDPSEYRRRFPKKAVKEFDQGVQCHANGKHDDALGHYQKAIALAPDFYAAHNNLGSVYLSKSDFAAARKEFEEVVRLNQSDSAGYFNLSNVCMLMGQMTDAEKYLEEGMRRQPDSALGHFLLGSLDMRLEKLSEGESALRQAIQLDPAMPQARLQLVNLLLRQGKKADAAAQLRDFIGAFPASPYNTQAKGLLERLETSSKPTTSLPN